MRYSDLILAGLVMGIVAMMIIPLPTFLLDILIATNISISVLLLLVSIYINDAVKIAAFPSILLITTLFRLGLNVSSTRLILLQADAGDVIYSFGNFVVAGNLIVGAVIFLILTLIQFVVIAKGSERVAEVAARFTLDAMPGKQMAIDADVRAGAIDMDAARRMRGALQRESQLYGSMDGAMKFVKGDAIAGILITIINIVGGLLIGVLQRGIPAGEAAAIYTQLTIGDGLVSQLPALLISTSAGIVVTRVASEDEGSHLGRDIGRQILAQPRAIALAAGLLALLGIVPGLPTIPFLTLSAGMGFLAFRRLREGKPRARVPRRPFGQVLGGDPGGKSARDGDELETGDEILAPPAALSIEVGAGLTEFVDAEGSGGRLMAELIPGLREMLYSELGIVLPGVHVQGDAAGLAANAYRLSLTEIPIAAGVIDSARVLVLADGASLLALGVSDAHPEERPGIAGPLCSVPLESVESLREAGMQLIDPPTTMVLHLGQLLRSEAPRLVGIQETQQLLDQLERSHPALVHEVVPKSVSVPMLAEVLRRLVEEGVSIRHLREVLEALAESSLGEKDPVVLVEHVRSALRRQISHTYVGPGGKLRAFILDPDFETTVRESIHRTAQGTYLAIEPELSDEMLQAVRNQMSQIPADEPPPVVLTQSDVRRYVRRLVELEFPHLPVLAFTELMPLVDVQLVARIAL